MRKGGFNPRASSNLVPKFGQSAKYTQQMLSGRDPRSQMGVSKPFSSKMLLTVPSHPAGDRRTQQFGVKTPMSTNKTPFSDTDTISGKTENIKLAKKYSDTNRTSEYDRKDKKSQKLFDDTHEMEDLDEMIKRE